MASDRPRLSTTERERLFRLHDGLCHICGFAIDGVRQKWEIDHVIPRGLKGRAVDTDENMQPAHERCHAVKTPKDIRNMAKAKRRWAKHIGAWRAKTRPMPGSRASGFIKRMDGTVERRPSC